MESLCGRTGSSILVPPYDRWLTYARAPPTDSYDEIAPKRTTNLQRAFPVAHAEPPDLTATTKEGSSHAVDPVSLIEERLQTESYITSFAFTTSSYSER